MALALDSQGDLYIADARSHRIRKIDTTGVITTVAGSGTQGFDGDGASATVSLLDSPGGLAVDPAGNLYLSDTRNHRVRRIDHVSGVITTIAGNSTQGYAGDSGPSQTAKLALPRGLSLDQQGNVYIADSANHRVRRIEGSTGTITTIAGDGTQGFAGDGGSPISASFDTPHAVTISPAGVGSIADTGNARIRQIVVGTSLQTVAGLGATVPGSLTLSGPSVIFYGTGQLAATLTVPGATGSIAFDSSRESAGRISTVALEANTAVLDTSLLPAGQHSIIATYSGDRGHGAARSALFSLTISPVTVEASVIPATIAYGQPVPALRGQLQGILARDSSNVSAAFSTTATMFSPVGSYPILVTLAGPAAGNYTVSSAQSFSITKARTTTSLTWAGAQLVNGTLSAGQAVTLTAHVISVTSGAPTGSVTIFDGGVALGALKTNASGDATLTASTLGAGAHSFTAVYSGDGNFTASATSPLPITVDSSPSGTADFALTTTGTATQTALVGSATSFTFTVQPQGGLASQVSLAASGLPNSATASFNPAYVPPGSPATSVTLTIGTAKASLWRKSGTLVFAVLFFPLAGTLVLYREGKSRLSLLGFSLLIFPVMFAVGCGDRIYTGDPAGTSLKSYTITVRGTATGAGGGAIEHAATVTLVVVSAH